jgi:hypothetical protein
VITPHCDSALPPVNIDSIALPKIRIQSPLTAVVANESVKN